MKGNNFKFQISDFKLGSLAPQGAFIFVKRSQEPESRHVCHREPSSERSDLSFCESARALTQRAAEENLDLGFRKPENLSSDPK
jgi:hypothetical protein